VVISPASDDELLARQAALQDEAREVIAGLDLAALAGDAGPLLVTGSFVSGLMCWRELDVMVLAGRDFAPKEELRERITAEQRIAVLRIKDHWHRQPAYPHHVGGLDIYTAVLDDGIRTLDQFAAWLAQRPEQTGGPAE
jgi:hypothetical protein